MGCLLRNRLSFQVRGTELRRMKCFIIRTFLPQTANDVSPQRRKEKEEKEAAPL
jgi:hypothetical protein